VQTERGSQAENWDWQFDSGSGYCWVLDIGSAVLSATLPDLYRQCITQATHRLTLRNGLSPILFELIRLQA
jgi:hypothetical protein